jgi:DNA repair and recombination protein RAD52
VSKRVGPGGKALYYLQGWQAIQVANEIFGYSGWSNALQSFQIDYCEQGPDSRWNAMATAVMRVTLLETGAFHEDVGCGVCDGMRTRGDALQKVKKEACTDAMKRALKNFGRRLGLMLYDKEFLAMLARGNVGGGALPGARDARQAPVVGRIPAIPSRPLGGAPKAKDSKTDRTRNMSLPPTLEPHPTISIPRGTSTDSSSCSGSAAVGVNETTVSNTPAPHAPPAAKDPAMTNGSECSWDLATRQELDSILQQFELDDEC